MKKIQILENTKKCGKKPLNISAPIFAYCGRLRKEYRQYGPHDADRHLQSTDGKSLSGRTRKSNRQYLHFCEMYIS